MAVALILTPEKKIIHPHFCFCYHFLKAVDRPACALGGRESVPGGDDGAVGVGVAGVASQARVLVTGHLGAASESGGTAADGAASLLDALSVPSAAGHVAGGGVALAVGVTLEAGDASTDLKGGRDMNLK